MKLSPYLTFNGQCETAFKFYQQSLGGNIQTMMTWGESPMADQVPAEWRDKIIHATMLVGDATLMASDAPPDRYEQPRGLSVTIHVNEPADAERIFHALAAKGTVQMPIQQTFWSKRFGMLVDQFGVPWMINCEQAA